MPMIFKKIMETKKPDPKVEIRFPEAVGPNEDLIITFDEIVTPGHTIIYEFDGVDQQARDKDIDDIDGIIVKRGKGQKEINTTNLPSCTGKALLIESDAETRGKITFTLPAGYNSISQAVTVKKNEAIWKPLIRVGATQQFFTVAPLNCLFCIT
jgi:hypothetical protein